jgi:adenylate cyclase
MAAHRFRRWRTARRWRLAAGLVLVAFVAQHLLSHAVGVFGAASAQAALSGGLVLWRNPVGGVLLAGAFLTHVALGFTALWRRRDWRMPWSDHAQWLLALSIPPLLFGHVLATGIAAGFGATPPTYEQISLLYWRDRLDFGVRQIIGLLVVWSHASVGLINWSRGWGAAQRYRPLMIAGLVVVPIAALAGTAVIAADVLSRAASVPAVQPVAEATRQRLTVLLDTLPPAYGAWLVLFFGAWIWRYHRDRARARIILTYPQGRAVAIAPGTSVLEASRRAGIPHAQACGGRGRCSTCRVRVEGPAAAVLPPDPAEAALLEKARVPAGVRLACQLRPLASITVTPLLPARTTAIEAVQRPDTLHGTDRTIAVLFTDIRGSTPMAERRTPFDVVFLLNQYFDAVGGGVEAAGGIPNQFIGDEVMALFGVDADRNGAHQALVAAVLIRRRILALSAEMERSVGDALKIGIGIHHGPAVLGRMGYRRTHTLTAVGDTVHVARRVEELSKRFAVPLVISAATFAAAGIASDGFSTEDVDIRGHSQPLTVVLIADPEQLAARLGLAATG